MAVTIQSSAASTQLLSRFCRTGVYQIAREMGSTLERVGGTVNTTQMHDYMAALYLANGDVLSAGDAMGWHVACAGFAVKRIIERFENDGGINPDDIFLLNDPYVAAIHQSDVYMVSPIHFKGKLMGWSATFVHVMDIGAMSPGGNSPGATEICHEGIRIPGIKLVGAGRTEKRFIRRVHQHDAAAGDGRARSQMRDRGEQRREIAECRHCIEQFGPELVTAVSQEMLHYSEVDLEKKNRGDSRRQLERDGKHSCGRYLERPRDSQQERRAIAVRLHRQQPAGKKGHQLALPCDFRRVLRGHSFDDGLRPAEESRRAESDRGDRAGRNRGEFNTARAGVAEYDLRRFDGEVCRQLGDHADAGHQRKMARRSHGAQRRPSIGAPRRRQSAWQLLCLDAFRRRAGRHRSAFL